MIRFAFLFLVWFSLFFNCTSTSFAASTEYKIELSMIKFEGLGVISSADLEHVFKPYLGKIISSNDQNFHTHIYQTINLHYAEKGYIFSRVINVKFTEQNLLIQVVEGHINNISFPKAANGIKDVQYLQGYIDKIKEIKPFNIKQADKYILRIKRLIGANISFAPILLDHKDPSDPAMADLVIIGYKKHIGRINVDNYQNAHFTNQTLFMPQNEYYSFANLYVTTMNPFYQPGSLSSYIATSGDSKFNSLSTAYKHQLNAAGTHLKTDLSLEYSHLYNKEYAVVTGTELIHPLISENHKMLDIGAAISVYETKNKLSKNQVAKLKFGINFAYVKPEKFEYDQKLDLSTGKGSLSKKQPPNFSITDKTTPNFVKLSSTSTANIILNKENNLNMILYLNAQLGSKNLPEAEYFAVGRYRGGRGFMTSDINGDSGLATSLEIYKLYELEHLFFKGFRAYGYVDAGVSRIQKQNRSGKGVAIGIGTNLWLANNLMFKVEVNQPLYKKSISLINNPRTNINKKQTKVFLGLTYNFSF